ncbi:MAG: sugar phosphate isomerase/epimerase family protein [Cyclobacteriaceae bacterium]|nr:sugar phosphate isomerase/epimerase family protein [Cyclobacteriaceae bacterium]
MTAPITDLSKLCIHTITTKPWAIEKSAEEFGKIGVKGISVWRDTLQGRNIPGTGDMIRSNGLTIVSLVRGGFFPSANTTIRQKAIDDNRLAIDEAAALGAPMVVLVCGAEPKIPLSQSRDHIKAGIESLLPYCEANNVKLAIEPLHPMYADTRSAINTLGQANDMAEYFDSKYVGVAVDVYHLWWDPHLEQEIYRCGEHGNLYAFHICDWLSPTVDMLNDRGLMGDGCIDIKTIRGWVEKAGFDGFNEVEIFSNKHWAEDQHGFLQKIQSAYLEKS